MSYKFTVKVELLKKAVKRIASFPDRNLLVRLTHCSDRGVVFETYSRAIAAFIETSISDDECESVTGNAVAVFPFKQFRTCVELLSLEYADVEVYKDTITISCGNAKTTIKTVDQNEFHLGTHIVPECSIKTPAAIFAKNVAEAGKWTAVDNAHYAVGGVLISKNKDGVIAVSTNGAVLCAIPIKGEIVGEMPEGVIIPAYAANMLSALCRDVIEEAKIDVNSDGVAISWENCYFRFGRLEGKFPNWRRMAPKEDSGSIVEFERDLMEGVVNSVCKLNDEDFKSTIIEFRPYEISLSFANERASFCDSIKTTNGELTDTIRVDGANLRWISTCPSMGNNVKMQFTNSRSPLVIRIDETLFVIAPCEDKNKKEN